MSRETQGALPLDWDPRTALALRLRELQLRPGERDLVLTIADLAGDAPSWSGPRTELASRLRVTPDTISRRIKSCEQAKALEVVRQPGRPSEFRLPSIAAPAPDPRTIITVGRDLWRACGLVMGLVVELVGAATRRTPPTNRSAPKRDPRQLSLPFAEPQAPPPTNPVKPPTIPLPTPVITPGATGGNPRRTRRKPSSPPPTVATPPPAEVATTPANSLPLNLESRVEERNKTLNSRVSYECFRRTMQASDVTTAVGIAGLFEIGVKSGALAPDDANRFRFFTACCHLVRTVKKTPWILFRKRMLDYHGCDGQGTPWQAWGATEDEDKAREMIRSLAVPSELQQRSSDLLSDQSINESRQRQTAALMARFPQLASH